MSKAAIITLSTLGVLAIGTSLYVNQHQKKTLTANAQTSQQVLTVYAAGPKPLSDQIIHGFEAKTGIKVKSFDGTTGKILSKVKAEQGNPQADVLILASMAAGVDLQKNGQLLTYQPSQAKHLNKQFKDTSHQLINYSASAVGITYNTRHIKSAPTDWSDLTTTPYRNQVTIPDPRTSGSSLDFINAYQMKHGTQLLKVLQENGADIGGANKEVLDAVITGEKIGFVYPKSGTLVNPRPAMILKASRHQAAAKQFIDYLLSAKVQRQIQKSNLIPGTTSTLTDPRNGEAIKAYTVNWTSANAALTKNVVAFNQVFSQ